MIYFSTIQVISDMTYGSRTFRILGRRFELLLDFWITTKQFGYSDF